MDEPKIGTRYLGQVYYTDAYRKMMIAAIKQVKELQKTLKFDAIAFTGCSGAAMAYPLSYRLGIPLICVRKAKSHYPRKVEGYLDSKRYLIVDDFVSSGKTMDKIILSIKDRIPEASPIGVYLYNDCDKEKYFYLPKDIIRGLRGRKRIPITHLKYLKDKK